MGDAVETGVEQMQVAQGMVERTHQVGHGHGVVEAHVFGKPDVGDRQRQPDRNCCGSRP
jgi:hypothetical protein